MELVAKGLDVQVRAMTIGHRNAIRCRVSAMQHATSLNLNDSVVAAVCS